MSGCKAMIWRGYGLGDSRCSRKAVADGWCKQHHPTAVAARDKARTDMYLARDEARVKRGLRDATIDQLRAEMNRRFK